MTTVWPSRLSVEVVDIQSLGEGEVQIFCVTTSVQARDTDPLLGGRRIHLVVVRLQRFAGSRSVEPAFDGGAGPSNPSTTVFSGGGSSPC